MKKKLVFMISIAILLTLTSCSSGSSSSEFQPNTIIKKFEKGKEINYFVRYNKGNTPVNLRDAGYVKNWVTANRAAISTNSTTKVAKDLNLSLADKKLLASSAIMKNNMKLVKSIKKVARHSRSVNNQGTYATEKDTEYKINDTKTFHEKNESTDNYESIEYKVVAEGEKCLVWCPIDIIDPTKYEKYEQISTTFDALYEIETELFGNPKGYWINDSSIYITETNQKIYILLSPNLSDTLYGYFRPVDLIKQQIINVAIQENETNEDTRSNESQMLFINSNMLEGTYFYALLSTIVHEFQHLLGYIHDEITIGKTWDSWYTEMLSVLAEDLLHCFICGNPETLEDPYSRLTRFTCNTNYGVTYWDADTDSEEEMLIGYAVNYAYGAFLFRNYGGAKLIKAMTESNNKVISKDAINYALNKLYPSKNYTFDSLAKDFYRILLAYSLDSDNLAIAPNLKTLNRQINFYEDLNYNGAKRDKLIAIAIDLNNIPGDNISTTFIDAGPEKDTILYPYGFAISCLSTDSIVQVTYEEPLNKNIEQIFR